MVSGTGKMCFPLSPFAPETLFSGDRFSSPVLRQPANSPQSRLNLVHFFKKRVKQRVGTSKEKIEHLY